MQRDGTARLDEFVGESPAAKSLLRQARNAAKSDSLVLITGEKGTGKEMIARVIHRMGKRHTQGFINLDCSDVGPAKLQAALFRHDRSRIEAANQGTLLLEHIENVSPELRSRLLRMFAQSESESLRSTTVAQIDLRLIATMSDIGRGIEDSWLRTGLSPEFKVMSIRVPALRERRSDIPLLAWHFVRKWARWMDKSIEVISPDTMKSLLNYSWPNNIRELDNVIERSVRSTEGSELRFGSLPENQKRA
ncbi:MAG: sigma 54-interacting transcriptional regulator [Terriglobales bacterium]